MQKRGNIWQRSLTSDRKKFTVLKLFVNDSFLHAIHASTFLSHAISNIISYLAPSQTTKSASMFTPWIFHVLGGMDESHESLLITYDIVSLIVGGIRGIPIVWCWCWGSLWSLDVFVMCEKNLSIWGWVVCILRCLCLWRTIWDLRWELGKRNIWLL